MLYRPQGIQSMINKISFEYKRGDDFEQIYQNNKELMTHMDIKESKDIFFKLHSYIDF